jgi:lipopolysaccharide transport system ATP-binding protein
MAIAIRASGIGKKYKIYGSPLNYLREILTFRSRVYHQDFWALQDIDLEVRQGDTLGIIGENGAGKSTLLKILTGITQPNSGQLETSGKIGALLELGSGFHPEYTGRENIYLAGAILDLSKKEIEEKIEEVITFSGISDFIDRPVKIYSTGMYLRLAFSIATMIHPDILVTDEILSVGDESFQKKCIKKMESYLKEGKTILFCSHNLFQVKNICKKGIWLYQGKIAASGQINHVVDEYLDFVKKKEEGEGNREERVQAMFSSFYTVIRNVRILDGENRETEEFLMGTTLNVEVLAETPSPFEESPSIGICILSMDQYPIYGISTDMEGVEPARIDQNLYRIQCQFPSLHLVPGRYTVRVHTLDHPGLRIIDTLEKKIRVKGVTREEGCCRMPHRWLPTERT